MIKMTAFFNALEFPSSAGFAKIAGGISNANNRAEQQYTFHVLVLPSGYYAMEPDRKKQT
jgi:hypothetical protein